VKWTGQPIQLKLESTHKCQTSANAIHYPQAYPSKTCHDHKHSSWSCSWLGALDNLLFQTVSGFSYNMTKETKFPWYYGLHETSFHLGRLHYPLIGSLMCSWLGLIWIRIWIQDQFFHFSVIESIASARRSSLIDMKYWLQSATLTQRVPMIVNYLLWGTNGLDTLNVLFFISLQLLCLKTFEVHKM